MQFKIWISKIILFGALCLKVEVAGCKLCLTRQTLSGQQLFLKVLHKACFPLGHFFCTNKQKANVIGWWSHQCLSPALFVRTNSPSEKQALVIHCTLASSKLRSNESRTFPDSLTDFIDLTNPKREYCPTNSSFFLLVRSSLETNKWSIIHR